MGNPFSGSSSGSVKSGLQNMGQMANGGGGAGGQQGNMGSSQGLMQLFQQMMQRQNPNAIGTLDKEVATQPGANNAPLDMNNYGG